MIIKKDIFQLLNHNKIKYNKKQTKQELLNLCNKKFLGRLIYTPPLGTYCGGFARIIEVFPDENAPEIVFQVKNKLYKEFNGEIGIFDSENYSIYF